MCRRLSSRFVSGPGEADFFAEPVTPVSIEACLFDSLKEVMDCDPGRPAGFRWLSIEGLELPEGPSFRNLGDISLEARSEYALAAAKSGRVNELLFADSGGGGGGACPGKGGAVVECGDCTMSSA